MSDWPNESAGGTTKPPTARERSRELVRLCFPPYDVGGIGVRRIEAEIEAAEAAAREEMREKCMHLQIEAVARVREEERRRCEAEIRKLRDECCRGIHEWTTQMPHKLRHQVLAVHPLTELTSTEHCAVCGVGR